MFTDPGGPILPPDTGSLHGDLIAIADEAIRVLSNPLIRRVIQSLVAEARHSPELAAVRNLRFTNPRRHAGDQMMCRAIERGEISPDTDLELAQDIFGGPVHFRGIILDENFPPSYGQRLTDAALRSPGRDSTKTTLTERYKRFRRPFSDNADKRADISSAIRSKCNC
jgi:hypothetical protein